jgi:cupin fold WbuC family metalloprotein
MENLEFEFDYDIPYLSEYYKKIYSYEAHLSLRRRSHLIIHNKGDEFNQVFNFVCNDSYMRPHLHPEPQMIEKMHLIYGSFKLIFFDNTGCIERIFDLNKAGQKVQVPNNTWHTYVMTSKISIIFETMIGVYNPLTWKKMPTWAPEENSTKAKKYFKDLQSLVV